MRAGSCLGMCTCLYRQHVLLVCYRTKRSGPRDNGAVRGEVVAESEAATSHSFGQWTFQIWPKHTGAEEKRKCLKGVGEAMVGG